MTKIEIRNLTVELNGKQILKDVSLTIEPGDVMALLGPTNAGKTTLLYTLAGFIKPTKGKIYIDGKDITGLPPQKRPIAMVFQVFALYPNMTVFENIASPLRIRKLSEDEVKRHVGQIATMLGIEKLLDKRPEELSGGEAQRVAIGRALAKGSDILLLDEPLVNLDYKIRETLISEFKRLLANTKITILYATSNPMEASIIAKTLAFIHDGRIIQVGPVEHCFTNPKNTVAMRNYSVPPANIFEASVHKTEVGVLIKVPGIFSCTIECQESESISEKCYVGLYPHDFSLTRKTDKDIEIKGKLLLTEIQGSDMVLSIKCGDNILLAYVPYVTKSIGEHVKLYISPEKIYIFNSLGDSLKGKLIIKEVIT